MIYKTIPTQARATAQIHTETADNYPTQYYSALGIFVHDFAFILVEVHDFSQVAGFTALQTGGLVV
jgi:hypothetical protein